MSTNEIFMTKVKRIFRTGFYNFWRNGTVSLASVLVMLVTLSVIAALSLGSAVLQTTLNELRDKIDINVSFVPGAAESDVLNIKHSLESLPEVALVTYITPQEALAEFKDRHQNDQSVLAALDELGNNPLGAVLNIKARDPSQYASVAEFLQGDGALSKSGVTIIARVNYFQNKVAIDRLSALIRAANKLGFILTLVLAGISMLIAFNTIRLTIYIAKDEIAVMRLVGASTTYIQGPFVVLGIIYGLVAGVLTLLLFLPITYYVGQATAGFFSHFNLFSYYGRHFLEVMGIVLGSGTLIGALSSMLAIRRYLKV